VDEDIASEEKRLTQILDPARAVRVPRGRLDRRSARHIEPCFSTRSPWLVEFTTEAGATVSFRERGLFPSSVNDSVAVRYNRRWPQRTATLNPAKAALHDINVVLVTIAVLAVLAVALGVCVSDLVGHP
jgi:hypothetical protein